MISRLEMSAGFSINPSVSANPTPKSSRSAGVAIMTACVIPLKVKAIAVSSGAVRTDRTRSFPRCARHSTLTAGGGGAATKIESESRSLIRPLRCW